MIQFMGMRLVVNIVLKTGMESIGGNQLGYPMRREVYNETS